MKPGHKLPTVRNLMKSYKVSLSTVNKALDCLRSEGLIKSQPGSGIFACRPAKLHGHGVSQVDIMFFGYEPSLKDHGHIQDLVHHLSQLYGRQGIGVRLSILSPDQDFEDYRQYLDKISPEAVITLNLYNNDVYSHLKKHNVPCVHISPNLPRYVENSVNIDNGQIAELWLEYLVGKGHRKIAFLHQVTERWFLRSVHEREKGFYRECARYGIIPDNRLMVYAGFSPEESYKALESLLNQNLDFTAVIANDHTVSGVYHCLHDHGLIVGKDISVMGIDGLDLGVHLIPPLTTLEIPRAELAKQAFEMLERIISDKKDQLAYFQQVRLVERESVADLNKF